MKSSNIKTPIELNDRTVDPFIDEDIRILYNNESGKVRDSNLYDFIYKKNRTKNKEVKEDVEREKDLFL